MAMHLRINKLRNPAAGELSALPLAHPWTHRMARTPASLLERLKASDNQDAWRQFVQL
jgi:hypothetical protein